MNDHVKLVRDVMAAHAIQHDVERVHNRLQGLIILLTLCGLMALALQQINLRHAHRNDVEAAP